MPTFEFQITRDVTETATVRVAADTIEEAQAKSLTAAVYSTAGFVLDDSSGDDPYLPDSDDYTEIA